MRTAEAWTETWIVLQANTCSLEAGHVLGPKDRRLLKKKKNSPGQRMVRGGSLLWLGRSFHPGFCATLLKSLMKKFTHVELNLTFKRFPPERQNALIWFHLHFPLDTPVKVHEREFGGVVSWSVIFSPGAPPRLVNSGMWTGWSLRILVSLSVSKCYFIVGWNWVPALGCLFSHVGTLI